MEREKRKNIKTIFAENLRNARKNAKMTQEQLAEAVDASPSIVSGYENAQKEAGVAFAREMAVALDTSLDLLCGIDTQEQYQNRLKESPVVALLTVLELFQLRVTSIRKNAIVFALGEDTADYSTVGIKQFFKEYKVVQDFARAYTKRDGSEEMVKQLKDHLIERFSELPGLLDYKIVSEDT